MSYRPILLSSLVVSLLTTALAATTQPSSASVSTSAWPALSSSNAPSTLGTVKPVETVRWGPRALARGNFKHTRMSGGLVIGSDPRRVSYDDPYGGTGRLVYDRGRWYSPQHATRFGFDELIASYNASTPVGTFIEVSVRGVTTGGKRSSWDSLGRWASHDVAFHRMSLGPQADDYSRVAVDTLVTDPGVTYRSWQLRLTLMRRAGSGKTPTLTMLAAVASACKRQSHGGS